jgi:hypothetical protein
MTAVVMSALLLHGAISAVDPGITLRLQPPERKPAVRTDSDGRREALMNAATSSGRRPLELTVVVRAGRGGAVWVDRTALWLEARDLSGAPLGSHCRVEPDDSDPKPDEVRLRAGETMTVRLTLGRSRRGARAAVCFGPGPDLRRGYTVVAVYEPADSYPFRLRPRDGATPLTKRVESNAVKIPPPSSP